MPFGYARTSSRTWDLLHWECANINAWLSTFGPGGAAMRHAALDSSGEFIRVLGLPLPASYRPANCDLVVIVNDFPSRPPIGLYLLNSDRAQVSKIEALFGGHLFRNMAAYDAPSIPG